MIYKDKQEHPSLTLKEKTTLKPAPLMPDHELTEIAKQALHKQVRKRIEELAATETTLQKMTEILRQMQQNLEEHLTILTKNSELERGVLEKLDRKLQ